MVVYTTGVKVRLRFGDSRSNRPRDIRLPHFVTDEQTTKLCAQNVNAADIKRCVSVRNRLINQSSLELGGQE